MTKVLPKNLTSYDLLKTFALVLMIFDHVGYYFFPEHLWLRALGRLSAPVWLFLIGYAQSRDFSPRMWIGIALMALSAVAVGQALLPLTILATMLVARAILDPVMNIVRRQPQTLYFFAAIFFVGTFFTYQVLEYGTEVFMIVMLGYMVRHRDELPFKKDQIFQFMLVATTAHMFFQTLVFFTFSSAQMGFVVLASLALMSGLLKFRGCEYAALTKKMPAPVTWFCQLCGRRSLEIYVLHIAIFRFVALYLGVEGLSLFNFHIF